MVTASSNLFILYGAEDSTENMTISSHIYVTIAIFCLHNHKFRWPSSFSKFLIKMHRKMWQRLPQTRYKSRSFSVWLTLSCYQRNNSEEILNASDIFWYKFIIQISRFANVHDMYTFGHAEPIAKDIGTIGHESQEKDICRQYCWKSYLS